MKLNLQRKKQVVSRISKVIGTALSAVVASLEGMTANEITNLRSLCRKSNVCVCVVRNTLMHRALDSSIFGCLQGVLVGSNIVAFSMVEPNDCARIFVQFSKENTKFKIKGAVFNGIFIEESKIHVLSSLPTYKDSIVNLIFVIRESAIGRLIRTLRMLSNK